MGVEVDKLLALKAFYLGQKITMVPQRVKDARQMVDVAIGSLNTRNGADENLRLLFYVLLSAEITRGSNESIGFRQEAMQIANDLNSNAFEYYMAIEEATQSKKHVGSGGFSAGVVSDSGVVNPSVVKEGSIFGGVTVTDEASDAVGVALSRLSSKEIHFLENTTLIEMLQHHGIDLHAKN